MQNRSTLVKLVIIMCAVGGFIGKAQAANTGSEQQLIKLILAAKAPEVFMYSPDKPFTLKSGKLSPIFINMGNISSGEAIARLGDVYAEAIVENKMEFDIVYGSAYKGIPLSVTIARSLFEKTGKNYPYVYNRKEVKDHGEGGLLVGVDLKGKRVLIVDDVITTGKDKIESMAMIEQAGGKVVGVVVSVDRREDLTALPGKVPVIAITTLDHLIKAKQNQATVAQRKAAEIIVPLDVDNAKQANAIVAQLDPKLCKVKVGMQLFTAEGPSIVKSLRAKGFDVFLDLKFMDIPNTVYNAVYQAAELNVWMLTVHTLGSDEMLAQAHQALVDFSAKHPQQRLPKLVGVTILTSVSDAELKNTFKFADMNDAVLQLASKANKYNLDGIVCSPNEAEMIRSHSKEFASNFVIVTPGIRMDDNKQDQVRVATPAVAVKAGSNYLVIGRPITQAKDPKAALQMFAKSIQTATASLG